MINPYEPPSLPDSVAASLTMEPHEHVRKRLSLPATILVLMASAHASFLGLLILIMVILWGSGRSSLGVLLFIGISSFLFVYQIFIVVGASEVRQLKSYRLGMLSMLLACIPILSPFFLLGIPFGIWGLTLLIPARAYFSDGNPIST
jgi:hypothetical protein